MASFDEDERDDTEGFGRLAEADGPAQVYSVAIGVAWLEPLRVEAVRRGLSIEELIALWSVAQIERLGGSES